MQKHNRIKQKNQIMKRFSLITGVAATVASLAAVLFSVSSCNPTTTTASTSDPTSVVKPSIAYVNLDRILQEYDLANDRMAVVQSRAESVEKELNSRGKKLEKEQKDFQDKINKGILTQSVAEQQYGKIQINMQNFENYAAQKQQELAQEATATQNEILDAISTYINKYNETAGYQMILATQAQGGAQTGVISIPVIAADASLDITDEILEGLNAEYVKNKAKGE